jgi:hypothetical protein
MDRFLSLCSVVLNLVAMIEEYYGRHVNVQGDQKGIQQLFLIITFYYDMFHSG